MDNPINGFMNKQKKTANKVGLYYNGSAELFKLSIVCFYSLEKKDAEHCSW